MSGQALAQLLLSTREAFVNVLELEQLSEEYLKQSRRLIDEYACFCEGHAAAQPWQLREKYLAHRSTQRSGHAYSDSYLENSSRELGYFLRWYQRRAAAGKVCWGQLSAGQLRAYWRTQRGALSYRHDVLAKHLPSLLVWLERRPECRAEAGGDWAQLLGDYFEQRRKTMRDHGYGLVLTHRAQMVTRRHLWWLEQQGHLPAGSAATEINARSAERAPAPPRGLLERFVAKVDPRLPEGLRQPLIDYVEHLACERELAPGSLKAIVHTNLTLCRQLEKAGHDCFARLRVCEVDRVVASLLSAPEGDLLRRRRQVQARHSNLRGFLGYLQRRGLLGRDLGSLLISPPCYRASTPPTVLSEQQVRSLLEAVDRGQARGRRSYAMLVLMTTYGLRPVDVSELELDAIQWRQKQIALVQRKTGRPLVLPLLAEVARALSNYLRKDRLPGLEHRRVFVSLWWPQRPVRPAVVSQAAAEALAEAGLAGARPRHLRSTVATHLLRQGAGLSTIQDVLGHRSIDTTQRYAATDVVLLRQVLEESER